MAGPQINVMIVSEEEELVRYLLQLLRIEEMSGEGAAGAKQALLSLKNGCPDVILLDADIKSPSISGLVTEFRRHCNASRIVCMIGSGDGVLRRSLKLLGVSDYVMKPPDDIEVVQTIRRVMAEKKQTFFMTEVASAPADNQGKVIAFFSTISGAGKTVLSLNLSAALARLGAGRVCIVDADLQFGDIARYLDHKATTTVVEYAAAFAEGASIRDYVSSWNQMIDFLAAPTTVREAGLVTPLLLCAAIKELSRHYQYVVIDTTAGFNEWTLSMIDLASQVFFVSTVEHVPAVRKVRIGLDVLHNLGYGKERVRLLLNRDQAKKGLDLRQVEEALGTKFQMKIANDYEAVVRSVQTGIPFVTAQPERVVSRQINELAAYVLGNAEAVSTPGNWFVRKLADWF
jgi:pilus assembly protein CpaE